jgi:hypothetical protein
MTQPQAQQFFASYQAGFNAADACAVTNHYAFPCVFSQSLVPSVFANHADLLANNEKLIANYAEAKRALSNGLQPKANGWHVGPLENLGRHGVRRNRGKSWRAPRLAHSLALASHGPHWLALARAPFVNNCFNRGASAE